MEVKPVFHIVFFILLNKFCYSQNLLLDGSFEVLSGISQSRITYDRNLSYLKYWFTPNTNSSDFFSKISKYYQEPSNYFGFQNPRTGGSYAGILPLDREYLSTSFTKKLEKGKLYCFELYWSLSDNSHLATSSIGIYFSKNKIYLPQADRMEFVPQIQNEKQIFWKEKEKWERFSGTYLASGGEEYLIIGSFVKKPKIKVLGPRKMPIFEGCYYYFDDVSVFEINEINECACRVEQSEKKIENEKPKENELEQKYVKGIVFKDVNFKSNESIILPQSFHSLDSLAIFLINHPKLEIEIEGHTDNIGNEMDNQILSEKRAKAIADYLNKKEISLRRIRIKGFGGAIPIESNETEEGRERNRRVEFRIIGNE